MWFFFSSPLECTDLMRVSISERSGSRLRCVTLRSRRKPGPRPGPKKGGPQETMLQLNQLSQGVQLALFFLLVGVVLIFIKINSYERRLKQMEESLRNYITYEDYMESFNNMFAAATRGESVAPFAPAGEVTSPPV